MADDAAVRALLAGADSWAEFREARMRGDRTDVNSPAVPEGTLAADLTGAALGLDLRGANLSEADLEGANLRGADLRGAFLNSAQLQRADLRDADLRAATLYRADLAAADLDESDLTGAKLFGSDLSMTGCQRAIFRGAGLQYTRLADADLTGADLTDADLTGATLVRTCLASATLLGCRVYGASVWDVDLTDAVQTDLVGSPKLEPDLVTDSLEVAQFLYLLLRNPKVRDVIDTIGKRAVLILGRFSSQRKPVLDAVREALRGRGWVPILFDFEGPATRDTTETVATLAHLSRFVIADLTDPRSVQQELTSVLPNIPSVAVKPIIHASQEPWIMFADLRRRHHWLLEPYRYESPEGLLAALEAHVVGPAEAKAQELTAPR